MNDAPAQSTSRTRGRLGNNRGATIQANGNRTWPTLTCATG